MNDGFMFFGEKGVCVMKRKLTMNKKTDMTLEEGCIKLLGAVDV